jgi:hypothetical protein
VNGVMLHLMTRGNTWIVYSFFLCTAVFVGVHLDQFMPVITPQVTVSSNVDSEVDDLVDLFKRKKITVSYIPIDEL